MEDKTQPDPRDILLHLQPKDTVSQDGGQNSRRDTNTKDGKDADRAKDGKNTARTEDGEQTVSLKTIIREQAIEDELPLTKNLTLKKILGGDILNADIIRRQIWVIMLTAMFIVVYISNRYKCQQDLILIDNLNAQLKDAKYRALSSSSDLTQQTRESKVLEQLKTTGDSTLQIPTQPPYIINVPNNDAK